MTSSECHQLIITCQYILSLYSAVEMPNRIKSQSGKAALEEMVGAGGNFGNSEEIFGGKD